MARKKVVKGRAAAAAKKSTVKGNKTVEVDEATAAMAAAALKNDRNTTGVLSSSRIGRDIHHENFSLSFRGTELITDTTLELNYGRRYGLIGANGSGKSTFLDCLANRDIEIPDHIDMFHLDREAPATDIPALEMVISHVAEEQKRLEEQAAKLLEEEGPECDLLQSMYERLEELERDNPETRGGIILHGLGFTPEMQKRATKEFSGGWRMRIALAKALFVKPHLLLLDEPTNHLDLPACVWLEEYLKTFDHILILISHSQDFLNGVCTNIMHLTQKKLKYYSGNFDAFVQTRKELEENQNKRYQWEQEQIANMKEYIARFGHGSAKLAKQAQSKEKTLAKMVANGLTEKVHVEKTMDFRFQSCGKLPPPVLQFVNVTFNYPSAIEKGIPNIYTNLDLGADLDSRIALVGPNGAGKSTLLKLINGELVPTDGEVKRHTHLRLKTYHQHLAESLDQNLSPVEFLMKCFPDEPPEVDTFRRKVGRFGITGKDQMNPIGFLSDGQKSRVVFAWLAFSAPHMLLLDEPTNHLDIETIDALADAINKFEGGVILVSHDFRLISQVAKEIWVCDKGTVTPFKGDITDYKKLLRQQTLDEITRLHGKAA
eukprot:TRINITY_DN281_c0_g1_i1.p1 TRINITY_DN281_c0_g1~~TRINITY_DN281_c0_g1_i1.p1  ORF type:complete len:602 (+),score=190.95 TRINITY_DN281_c0_g1_i1:565-2370(+)